MDLRLLSQNELRISVLVTLNEISTCGFARYSLTGCKSARIAITQWLNRRKSVVNFTLLTLAKVAFNGVTLGPPVASFGSV
jgi:hypothetical protein